MIPTAGYHSVMPLRPHHDSYRSLPGSPMPMDSRTLSGSDIGLAMNHVRMGLDAPDYFHQPGGVSTPRYNGGMKPPSPYLGEYESERYTARFDLEIGSPEMLHRINTTNLAASLANSQISYSAKYGKVYPHLSEDGRYPSDFNVPKTVESVKLLDNSQLDRIFQAYRLPTDIRPMTGGNLYSKEGISSTRVRQAKVLMLLEYLGAWKIVEHERLKRAASHW